VRIAIVSECFDNRGGSERRTWRLVEQLLRRGHEVHVFARQIEAAPGVVCHRAWALPLRGAARLLSFAWSVRRQLAATPFDAVHHQIRPYGPGLVTAAGGCHCHFLEQKLQSLSPLGRLTRRLRPLDLAIQALERRRYQPGGGVRVITNSRLGKETILRHHPLPGERIRVIYNGVDQARFSPQTRAALRRGAREALGFRDEDVVLLWIGSDTKRKGLDKAVEALSLLEPHLKARLPLLAVGRAEPGLAELAEGRGVRLRFASPRSDVEFYFGAADAFVLPTLFDPFANASFEAMACGLPVLTTTANGVSELIEEGRSGLLVGTPVEPPALAEKLTLLAERGLRQEMGGRARQATLPYTWEANAEETLALYAEAAREGP
jgi:UDP-glucose:(heptosyl)LPS alpha-1,3-glucosyltransferase